MDGHGSCAVAGRDRRTDAAILGLLLNFEAGSLWSVEEVVRQLGAARVEVIDALANLQAAGLVHRVGDFVFATRAASSFDQLEV
jgi:DNA-binding IclR family transcriptional regulator